MALVALPPVIPITCPAAAKEISSSPRCGFVRVPLDRTGAAPGTVRVYFEHYPQRDRSQPPESTVLSLEGGPGYPTAADRDSRAALWVPLAQRRALLLVDLRGTGRSDALACPSFAKTTLDYIERAGRCAQELGPRRDYYGTGDAVEDLEDVLLAIRAGPVDLYGDSYGTYAAQAFALRHPERLRSLTLDAAYPLPGTDPAYADLIAAFRRGLRLTCQRRPGCPAGERREDAIALLSAAARKLAAKPISGVSLDGDGNLRVLRVDEDGLAQIAGASYYSYVVWRDLLAAVVAYEDGDNAPLLRLGAEHIYGDVGAADPPSFSDPLYLAVTCHDYPQLWDPDTPIALRAEEAAARLGGYPVGTFTPFTAEAWTSLEYEGPLACMKWPSPAAGQPPEPAGARYPKVPTLVLNGDLDTITASSGAKVVAEKFPRSWFVEVSNSIHVTALGDRDSCASLIYVNFVRELRPGDTSCASKVPEIRVVPRFAKAVDDVDAGHAEPGNDATGPHRKIAVAAAHTVADVVSRWWVNYDGDSRGLHGGTWSYSGDEDAVFTLDRVVLVPGIAVSGEVTWAADGSVTADLDVRAPRGERALVDLAWSYSPLARATLTGWVAGERLEASMLAP
jgi:pimeloyl-ACP methyl ester carboxylesterase